MGEFSCFLLRRVMKLCPTQDNSCLSTGNQAPVSSPEHRRSKPPVSSCRHLSPLPISTSYSWKTGNTTGISLVKLVFSSLKLVKLWCVCLGLLFSSSTDNIVILLCPNQEMPVSDPGINLGRGDTLDHTLP